MLSAHVQLKRAHNGEGLEPRLCESTRIFEKRSPKVALKYYMGRCIVLCLGPHTHTHTQAIWLQTFRADYGIHST